MEGMKEIALRPFLLVPHATVSSNLLSFHRSINSDWLHSLRNKRFC